MLDAQHRGESTVRTIASFYEIPQPESAPAGSGATGTPAGPQLSPAAAALLDGCLSFDPARRPSLDQIMQSCWLDAHCGPCAVYAGPGTPVPALTAQPLQTPPGLQTPPETPPGLAPLRTPPLQTPACQTPPGLALTSGRSPGGVAEAAAVAEVVREVRVAASLVEVGMPVPRPVRQEAQTSASHASDLDRSSATSRATTSSGHSRASSAGSAAAISGAAIGLQQLGIVNAIGLQQLGIVNAIGLQQLGLPLAAFAVAGAKQHATQCQDAHPLADTAGPKAADRVQGAQSERVQTSRWRFVDRAAMRAPRNK